MIPMPAEPGLPWELPSTYATNWEVALRTAQFHIAGEKCTRQEILMVQIEVCDQKISTRQWQGRVVGFPQRNPKSFCDRVFE
jgi:hypothetical protein